MKVAAINASPSVYNLAVEKVASYHRARGDGVYAGPWGSLMLGGTPTRDIDRFYFSVIFSWDLPALVGEVNLVRSWGKEVEIGGPAATFMATYIERRTGVKPHRGLDQRFERQEPRDRPYELTFTSRGCPHRCPFCGVSRVEPDALEYDDFSLAPMIGDNNILATSWAHQEMVVNKLVNFDREIDINSGFDVRFFQERHLKLYSGLRLQCWRFAFDTMEVEKDVRRVAAMMRDAGLDRHQVTFYVLIGFPGTTPQECLYRLNTIIELGMMPYPMRFWPLNCLNREMGSRGRYVAPGYTEDFLYRASMYFQTPFVWMATSWDSFDPAKKGVEPPPAGQGVLMNERRGRCRPS